MYKILYIQNRFGLGGINRITSVKENYLVSHGYDVHHLNTFDEECISPNGMYDDRIVMHAISLKKLNQLLSVPILGRILRFVYYRWQMLRIIYNVRPNMIVANMPRLEPISVILLSFWKKRILEIHGWFNNPEITKLSWGERVYFFFSSLFYQIVALTRKEAEKIKKLTGCSVRYIPNPLYIIPKQASLCNGKRVIALGRFSSEKNFSVIIPYWKVVEEKHPDWELHFYGDGYEGQRMLYSINENGLKSVYIHPYTKDVTDIFLKSSIYILPSKNEGFSLALLESMSMGVPCVAYDCPFGPSEIINDGEDGFLTEYDKPKALIDMVLFLIEHDDVRKEMGRKARKNIQRFNLDEIMEKWMKLFDEI